MDGRGKAGKEIVDDMYRRYKRNKFPIYPLFAKHTGIFHIKTSGTSWLGEVCLIIAEVEPSISPIDNFRL